METNFTEHVILITWYIYNIFHIEVGFTQFTVCMMLAVKLQTDNEQVAQIFAIRINKVK